MKSYNHLWERYIADDNVELGKNNALKGKRDRTTLRKSIMIKASRKAKRLWKKNQTTIHDTRQMLSYNGWLKATDTYQFYIKHIKPYVDFGRLKHKISKHDRRVNNELVQGTV